MSAGASEPLEALAAELRDAGGLLAGIVAEAPDRTRDVAPRVIGPRTERHPDEYGFLIEAVREGYLVHYDRPRILDPAGDADLGLLAGDRLYALGLARLAALGDLEGIDALAELISGCARVHAEGRPDEADEVWAAGLDALAGRGA